MELMENPQAMTRRTALIAAACLAGFAALGTLLVAKSPTAPQLRYKPALGGWIPPSLDPKPAGTSAWRFEYPTDPATLPVAPVNEPHVVLNLGRPLPLRSVRLAAEPGAAYKAWINWVGEGGTESILPLGEAKGAEVEMQIPAKAANRPITSLRLSYKPGERSLVAFATLRPAAVRPEVGKCYLVALPDAVDEADDSNHERRSTVVVLEDGKPLGKAHSVHDDIRKLGGGRYSHWGLYMMFSTSDGTDPRTNGRKYTVARPMRGEIRLQVS